MSDIERVTPADIDAEAALIGSMLLDQRVIADVVGEVTDADFHRPAHGRIFAAILSLHNSGHEVDMVSVADRMTTLGTLEESGGRTYLIDLGSATPTSMHWRRYADIVSRTAAYRRLIRAGVDIVTMGYDAPDDVDDALAKAAHAIDVLQRPARNAPTVAEVFGPLIEGYRDKRTDVLRDETFGLRFGSGDFWVVGAYEKTGKTSFATQLAYQLAGRHLDVAFYSYEMGADQIAARYIQAATGYDLTKLENGIGDVADGLAAHMAGIDNFDRMRLIEAADMTLDAVCSDVRKRVRKGCRMVFIDYLQLMVDGSDTAEVTKASRRMKLLAAETKCPILVLSQLRKQTSDQAASRRPQASDLRQSGAMAQDADGVVLLWKPDPGAGTKARSDFEKRGYHVSDPAYQTMDFGTIELARARHGRGFWAPTFFDGGEFRWHSVNQNADGRSTLNA